MSALNLIEQAAAEIKALRNRVETLEQIRMNQTIRVAISQLKGNKIDYGNVDAQENDVLITLLNNGRLQMDTACEVMLDFKPLTKELLIEEMEKMK